MATLPIRIIPDPILKQRAEEVEDFDSALHKLLDDMAETMYEAPGIGLAAPQIGVSRRIAIVDISEDKKGLIELINPEIVNRSGSVASEEGCLSIPEYRDSVTRSKKIEVVAQDRHGKEFSVVAEELMSFALQHEIDHLDGVLFVDRLSYLKKQMWKKWLKKNLEAFD